MAPFQGQSSSAPGRACREALQNSALEGYSPRADSQEELKYVHLSPAYAQAAGGQGGHLIAMLDAADPDLCLVFYFLLIRPQQTADQGASGHGLGAAPGRQGGHRRRAVRDGNQRSSATPRLQVEIAENVRVRVARARPFQRGPAARPSRPIAAANRRRTAGARPIARGLQALRSAANRKLRSPGPSANYVPT